MKLPRVYPIVDATVLSRNGWRLEEFALALHAAGIRFLQYRDKEASDEDVLRNAERLRRIFPAGEAILILNDRVHLCAAAGFDGVHVGQDDLSAAAARDVVGGARLLGLSTHNAGQVQAAEREPVDYIAIGPIFGTGSKANPDPVVGLEGVRAARAVTGKPLVAIGGITEELAAGVLQAGADSIALISAMLPRFGSERGKVLADILTRIG